MAAAVYRDATSAVGSRLKALGVGGRPGPQPVQRSESRPEGRGAGRDPLLSRYVCTTAVGTDQPLGLSNVLHQLTVASQADDKASKASLASALRLLFLFEHLSPEAGASLARLLPAQGEDVRLVKPLSHLAGLYLSGNSAGTPTLFDPATTSKKVDDKVLTVVLDHASALLARPDLDPGLQRALLFLFASAARASAPARKLLLARHSVFAAVRAGGAATGLDPVSRACFVGLGSPDAVGARHALGLAALVAAREPSAVALEMGGMVAEAAAAYAQDSGGEAGAGARDGSGNLVPGQGSPAAHQASPGGGAGTPPSPINLADPFARLTLARLCAEVVHSDARGADISRDGAPFWNMLCLLATRDKADMAASPVLIPGLPGSRGAMGLLDAVGALLRLALRKADDAPRRRVALGVVAALAEACLAADAGSAPAAPKALALLEGPLSGPERAAALQAALLLQAAGLSSGLTPSKILQAGAARGWTPALQGLLNATHPATADGAAAELLARREPGVNDGSALGAPSSHPSDTAGSELARAKASEVDAILSGGSEDVSLGLASQFSPVLADKNRVCFVWGAVLGEVEDLLAGRTAPEASPWGNGASAGAGSDAAVFETFGTTRASGGSPDATPSQPDELSVFEGDAVEVLEESEGWALVKDPSGAQGLVPLSYLAFPSAGGANGGAARPDGSFGDAGGVTRRSRSLSRTVSGPGSPGPWGGAGRPARQPSLQSKEDLLGDMFDRAGDQHAAGGTFGGDARAHSFGTPPGGGDEDAALMLSGVGGLHHRTVSGGSSERGGASTPVSPGGGGGRPGTASEGDRAIVAGFAAEMEGELTVAPGDRVLVHNDADGWARVMRLSDGRWAREVDQGSLGQA
ncbi:hypothetical protein F751_5212 [Auxenochlorella protothecoides]|uniref:SH3 domain-containing protein n=1 Tax=Auxenochlorella protothecoides TaxID=3075 RepID=A0A087SQU7_AUXPR|nr:hypothetical protein F751_5212 [Auxenochlorella protothecoides]KFM28101.1 hypothetical protein F751_5212 [Auxenochlorella protothecoides]